jgi:RimJ/RimL family protein N-acetyltransferase
MWRQGLASEAARAICQEAFERVGAPSVIARVQPENRASAGVAARLRMSHEFDTTGRYGETVSVYRLLAADWLASRDGSRGNEAATADAIAARTTRLAAQRS